MTPVADLCALIDAAIVEYGIEGVSFSGGEPFAQAGALAEIAAYARSRGCSTLAFTGYTLRELRGPRAPAGAEALLRELDVVKCGRFVARRARNDPLRGSDNQRLHFLTGRYGPDDVHAARVEVRETSDGRTVMTGVVDYEAVDAILAIFGCATP